MKKKSYDYKQDNKHLEGIFREGTEMVYEILKYGLNIPEYVPAAIIREGKLLFEQRLGGHSIEYAGATRNSSALKSAGLISTKKDDFKYSIIQYGSRQNPCILS
ncbi:MAG: hypothetical protein GX974_00200 [Clostridiales bacterium]|nr:hypothetical protein [Clostridiales bacterium]